jgi:hypothetical protein
MTLPQVTKAIGVPPGLHYTNGPPPPSLSSFAPFVRETGLSPALVLNAATRSSEKLTVKRWLWDDYSISVGFDEDGEAVGFYLVDENPSPSFLDRMRRLVGL